MIATDELTNPAVRHLVTAINDGDRAAFRASLTSRAVMTDDGSRHDLNQWAEREIFTSHGHLDVESESEDGLALIARYRNDTWGEMRTSWRFWVTDDGRVSRFDTGQA
jgi:hypothetical protein